MSSLNQNFKELRERLERGRFLSSFGTEPVFYLVFPPTEILVVKSQLKAWKGQLANAGWEVEEFSLLKMIHDYLQSNDSYSAICDNEPKLREGLDSNELLEHQARLAQSLQAVVIANGRPKTELMASLFASVDRNNNRPKGLLLITDVEALHPLLRINAIETQLLGKVKQPVVVLYPGVRHGQTSLSFLGIYPPDPNYRSEHIG